MNWDYIQGHWNEYAGALRAQWGELTNDDLDQIKGDRQQLVGCLQRKYGYDPDEAEQQVKFWETTWHH